jgi:hypothetical protein
LKTITIPISEERLEQLTNLAQKAGVAPEELLVRQVESLLNSEDYQFLNAANHILQKNKELYKRLA